MPVIDTKRFGQVLVVGALLGLQNQILSFYHAQGVRQRVFNAEWTKEHLERDHQKFMGADSPAPLLGYPDMGAGIYSRLLSYKDWFAFNCAQRVHQNNVEHLAWTLPIFFLNGIFFPRLTAGLGAVVLVGRELYRAGYMSLEGPTSKIREYGAYPLNIAEALGVLSVSFVFLRYQFGGMASRRRIVRYFTHSQYDLQHEKLLKEIKDAKMQPINILPMTPGEFSEQSTRRDRKLKMHVPNTRFDR